MVVAVEDVEVGATWTVVEEVRALLRVHNLESNLFRTNI